MPIRVPHLLLVGLLVGWPILASAQNRDSSSTRLYPPPDGRGLRIAGLVTIAVGAANYLVGDINKNRADPCEGEDSPFFECVSNVEDVRSIGEIQQVVGIVSAGSGALLLTVGIIRGAKYQAWSRRQHGVSLSLVRGHPVLTLRHVF